MIKILKLSIVIIYYRFKFAILLNYKLKQIKMKRTILGLDVEKNTETVKKIKYSFIKLPSVLSKFKRLALEY